MRVSSVLSVCMSVSGIACSLGDAQTSDAGITVTDGGTPDAGAGPITGLVDDQWTWVPFPDAHCRNGSSTGIGVNPHAGATRLVIFLEGGGACFNAASCAANADHFDQASFDRTVQSDLGRGIFDRTDPANPLRDASLVFVPYCTGDVHAGDKPDGDILTLGAQEYVGYSNVTRYLQRIVPTFSGITRVALMGASAGGFGAVSNYLQVAAAFPSVPVDLVDDAAPEMRDPYLAACLQQQWIDQWGLDRTVIAACGADCSNPGETIFGVLRHATAAYPQARFGLISTTGDAVMRAFFGFGNAACGGFAPVTEESFQAGLLDLRSALASQTNNGDFLSPGLDHTALIPDLDTRTAAGVKLTDWLTELLNGNATRVGP